MIYIYKAGKLFLKDYIYMKLYNVGGCKMKTCPICGDEMVLRQGPKVKFYGCCKFPDCIGKRDLNGNVFGCSEEEPYYINDIGSPVFQACIHDGFNYEEAAECAADWQRQEENDHWK